MKTTKIRAFLGSLSNITPRRKIIGLVLLVIFIAGYGVIATTGDKNNSEKEFFTLCCGKEYNSSEDCSVVDTTLYAECLRLSAQFAAIPPGQGDRGGPIDEGYFSKEEIREYQKLKPRICPDCSTDLNQLSNEDFDHIFNTFQKNSVFGYNSIIKEEIKKSKKNKKTREEKLSILKRLDTWYSITEKAEKIIGKKYCYYGVDKTNGKCKEDAYLKNFIFNTDFYKKNNYENLYLL